MKHRTGTVIHFVKLINAANTIVTQHQGTTVEYINMNSLSLTTFFFKKKRKKDGLVMYQDYHKQAPHKEI